MQIWGESLDISWISRRAWKQREEGKSRFLTPFWDGECDAPFLFQGIYPVRKTGRNFHSCPIRSGFLMWSALVYITESQETSLDTKLSNVKKKSLLSSHIVLQIRWKIANLNLADDATKGGRRARAEGMVREYVRNTHACMAWQAPFTWVVFLRRKIVNMTI